MVEILETNHVRSRENEGFYDPQEVVFGDEALVASTGVGEWTGARPLVLGLFATFGPLRPSRALRGFSRPPSPSPRERARLWRLGGSVFGAHG